MSIWVPAAAIIIGLLAFIYGSGNRFGNFRGNFAQRVRGSVNQSYTEAPPSPPPSPSKEERFVKWAGLVIALGGLLASIVKLFAG